MINCAIIGCGYWGPNYARVINNLLNCNLKWCCDLKVENLEAFKKQGKQITTDYQEVINDKEVDAIVIATPLGTHFDIAKDSLIAGKHVLVEKPITNNSIQALKLIDLAKETNKILMVGHIFKFNPGINKLKELIEDKTIGNILYLHFMRTGLGPIRNSINALWDLAPHDISILLHILKEKPLNVIAKGECYVQKEIEDVVFLTIEFENKILANLHVSWLDPYKMRAITVVGDKKMVVFDDISNETIKLFDKGVSYLERGADYAKFRTLLRDGDILLPKIDHSEPLAMEFKHFINCIKQDKKPLSDGIDGYNVVKILEAAQKSLKTQKGTKINL